MYINNSGHMTKWLTDFNETWHEALMNKCYNVYINHDLLVALTYFTARST